MTTPLATMTSTQKRPDRPRILTADESALLTGHDVVLTLLWHLGDVLNATALLPALTAKHKHSVVFATTRSCIPLLENNPYVKDIVAFDIDVPTTLTFGHFDLVKTLIRRHFWHVETVYNLHIPVYLPAAKSHIVEYWANAIGVAAGLQQLKASYDPDPPNDLRFPSGKYFILGNGGSSGIKHWRLENWRVFVELMRARFPDLELLQLGSRRDPLIEGATDLRGETSLAGSYCLLSKADGCLSNDSLLCHLSSVSGCRTYVIYGTHDPLLVHPIGKASAATFGGTLPCSPCYRDWCIVSLGLTSCLAHPSVREVFSRVERDLVANRSYAMPS